MDDLINRFKNLILGDHYFFGEDITPNYQMAFNYYNKGKEFEQIASRLGLCYLFGLGVNKEIDTAIKLLKKDGNKYSIFGMGYYEYYYEKNYKKAFDLFMDSDFYMSYYMLGKMRYDGIGCEINYEIAKRYFIDFLKNIPIDNSILKLVNPGYSSILNQKTYTNEIPLVASKVRETVFYLANIYEILGEHLLSKVCKALLSKGIESDDLLTNEEIIEIYNLGNECYQRQDNTGFYKWYNLAAELGYKEAQYKVAILHTLYPFGSIDTEYWMKKAAAQGHKKSIDYLIKNKIS